MRFKNFRHTSIAVVAALALLVSCFFQSTVAAQDPDQPIVISRAFGLARDQSVRLTVFMPEGPAGIAHVKLFDGLGNSVAESAEVRISGGTFHSFHFEPDDIHLIGEEGTGRRQLRASCWIRVGGPWAGRASATLEIIEASSGITDGTSNTVLVGEHCLGCPQVGPVGDLNDFSLGIVPGQSVRFIVFNPEEPDSQSIRGKLLRVTVKAGDVFGREVAVSRRLQISPRQFGWVDFNYNDLAIEPETRTGRKQALFKLFALIVKDPSPSVQPFFSPGTLIVTGEVVDNSTGKTLVAEMNVIVHIQF
ncbi:MAG TPA: hypothetical protein VLA93_10700 [Pyrinomonadaceae bacterium]|nr:hypothetical protein [Pyrinomonadaceae bacterium]